MTPWCTSTGNWGVKRAASFCQLPTTEVGQTKQDRVLVVSLPLPGDQGQGLHGLAKSHVVGQTGPQTPLLQKAQPGITPHLIGSQDAVKVVGDRQFGQHVLPLHLRQEIADPALGLQSGKRGVAWGVHPSQGQMQGFPGGDTGSRFFSPEVEGCLNLLGV